MYHNILAVTFLMFYKVLILSLGCKNYFPYYIFFKSKIKNFV